MCVLDSHDFLELGLHFHSHWLGVGSSHPPVGGRRGEIGYLLITGGCNAPRLLKDQTNNAIRDYPGKSWLLKPRIFKPKVGDPTPLARSISQSL